MRVLVTGLSTYWGGRVAHELEQRWGGWSEEPFTAASVNHVSVYRKPG